MTGTGSQLLSAAAERDDNRDESLTRRCKAIVNTPDLTSDEKLAALRDLVGSITHKVRNSLMVVDVRVQFLLPLAEHHPAIARHVTPLAEEVERLKVFLKGLA
jgi:hypothetical protein